MMTSPAPARTTSITAAIANAPAAPFEIATCESADPQHGEVLVRVHACGVCHTDMAVKLQHIPIAMPEVLGHEGAGIIEKVGPGTTQLRPGDHVRRASARAASALTAVTARSVIATISATSTVRPPGRRLGADADRQVNQPPLLLSVRVDDPRDRDDPDPARPTTTCRWSSSHRWDAESRPEWER